MTTSAVPFCDLARANTSLREDMDRAIRECIDSSYFLRGPQTQAFEEEWAAYCGQSYAVTCNSGTDALTIAAAAMGLEHASIPANTLSLTAIGVHRGGTQITLVDVDDDGWPMHPDSSTVQVLLYGRLPRARDPQAALYDAAHAHGWKPPHGAVAAWSFYPTKTLGALGDGGAVTTNDRGLAELMRDLCGRDDRFRDSRQLTSRMDEMQAAVLRVKLRHLDRWLSMRREIAAAYDLAFREHGITLQGPSLHHLYCVRTAGRDALQRALESKGIGTKVHWEVPLHKLQGPWSCAGSYMGAERWSSTVLSLPCYPGLDAREVDRVTSAVLEHLLAS